MKEYNRNNIPNARKLRKESTPWERKLWYLFLKDYPVRFQRQKAVDNYILDFYCAGAQLAIELDGSGHFEPEQQEYDALRTKILNQQGIQVLRICNTDIDRNFTGVCEYIDLYVRQAIEKPELPVDWKHK